MTLQLTTKSTSAISYFIYTQLPWISTCIKSKPQVKYTWNHIRIKWFVVMDLVELEIDLRFVVAASVQLSILFADDYWADDLTSSVWAHVYYYLPWFAFVSRLNDTDYALISRRFPFWRRRDFHNKSIPRTTDFWIAFNTCDRDTSLIT